MSIDDIKSKVEQIIAEQLNLDASRTPIEGDFTLLGGDSLDHVEIIMAIEDEFGFQISDDDADAIKTVQQAIDYVSKQVAA